MDDLKTQFAMTIIKIHNIIYNLIPFFFLKNIYLRITGSEIGHSTYIHTWVNLTFLGRMKIGDNCTVNFNCHLDVRGKLTIGNNVMIGHCCKIYTVGHNIDDGNFTSVDNEVTIGDNVVIFPNSLIMPGVKIANNAVIMNGSVVTKNVEEGGIVGGNPAKFIRQRKSNQTYKLNYKYWWINS